MAGARKSQKTAEATYPAGWSILEEITLNGRQVVKGTELSIRGETGRFRFVKMVERDDGVSWIDVWGGPKNAPALRSFSPDRVRTVHRIEKTPENLLKARKESK